MTGWLAAAGGNSPSIPAPHVEYGQLSPMLIVFGAAIAGILAEAFLPRRSRYGAQLGISLLGLGGAFAAVVVLAAQGYGTTKAGLLAMGAVAIDGPALFLQGVILLTAVLAVLTYAERKLEPRLNGHGVDAFTAQASAVPGGEQERDATRAGFATTEVFPLTLFAVGGMLLFPAANDLLTMFVALEVFSSRCTCSAPWPAAVGCSPRRRRSSTSCSAPSPRRSSCSAPPCCTATRAASSSATSPTWCRASLRSPRPSPSPPRTTRCC
ncbi:hypothetical protein GCM10025734_49600 [Kitasatospora paranensis]